MEIFLKPETEEDLERIIRYNIGKASQVRKEIELLDSIDIKQEKIEIPEEIISEEVYDDAVEENDEEYLYYYLNIKEALENVTRFDEMKEALLENLPTINNKNYINIVNRIKLEYIKERFEMEELKKCEDDPNFILEVDKEISLINKILELINETQTTNIEESLEVSNKNNNKLIFLQTHSGSTYAENDLYQIPTEYYESFSNLLSSIEEGTFKNVKKFAKNNNILKGISEVKEFKTRVVFDRIDKNTYIIIYMFMKKTDKDMGYKQAMDQRVDYYKKNKESILNALQDELYITEQQEIRNNLFDGLNKKNIIKTMKRG